MGGLQRLGRTAAIAACVCSCATWRPYELPSAAPASGGVPYRLRATTRDSTRVELTAAFVSADTLYGRVGRDTVGLALAEVARLERERLSPWRTLGLMVGAPAGALAVIYLIHCGDGGCQPSY